MAAEPLPVVLPKGKITLHESDEGKDVVQRVIRANAWRLGRVFDQARKNGYVK